MGLRDLALVPPLVVQDGLKAGLLVERCSIPQIAESLQAITGQRKSSHPLRREMLQSG